MNDTTSSTLFTGSLVRLAAMDRQAWAETISRWSLDSEYERLLTTDPTRPKSVKKASEWIEKNMEQDAPTMFNFGIRTLDGDRLIGNIDLDGIRFNHGDTFVGIGIGEREYWGKGYGTDAMRVILRFAFTELNLHRVSLNVFEYNQRAIHYYEKAGFVYEGRILKLLHRGGQRYDLVYMGILRSEWVRSYQ